MSVRGDATLQLWRTCRGGVSSFQNVRGGGAENTDDAGVRTFSGEKKPRSSEGSQQTHVSLTP